MYTLPADHQLEQGDILDGCSLPVFREDLGASAAGEVIVLPARVVILTQTCDLVQGKAARVVVAVCYPAQTLIDRNILKPVVIRDQVRTGKMYGWYFLPKASDEIDLPESVIDLRDLHTVPRPLLEKLAADGKRVCRLVTPFREHLAQHFAVTYMRIALPAPYETQP